MRNSPKSSEKGQALVSITATITLLLGALGLVIDIGYGRYEQQRAQSAVEAAAMAGVEAADAYGTTTCGTNVVCQSTTACPTSINPASITNNIQNACLYGQANGFGSGGSATMTIASGNGTPPTVSGATALYWVTATASISNNTLFSYLMGAGSHSTTSSAQATAGVSQYVPATCVYVLDPTGATALNASNAVQVQSQCGMAVNSNNADAVEVVSSAKLTLPSLSIVGGYETNNNGQICSSGGCPLTPATGVAASADPFASLPAPSYSGCNYNNYSSGYGTFTLSPGVYCGGLSINNGATVTFSPGTYIINGGSLTFAGGTTSTGNGVMFYLTGTNANFGGVQIGNGITTTLTAPTSGTYQGILFYQDRNITSSVQESVEGGATMQLGGSLYFPTTTLNYANGTNTTQYYTSVVAKDLVFAGGAYIKYDSTGATTGMLVKTAALLQ
jgi:hypothetical protein